MKIKKLKGRVRLPTFRGMLKRARVDKKAPKAFEAMVDAAERLKAHDEAVSTFCFENEHDAKFENFERNTSAILKALQTAQKETPRGAKKWKRQLRGAIGVVERHGKGDNKCSWLLRSYHSKNWHDVGFSLAKAYEAAILWSRGR